MKRMIMEQPNEWKETEWIFTFGFNQPLAGKCVRIKGDYCEARNRLWEIVGRDFAFQYPASEWDKHMVCGDAFMEKEITLEEVQKKYENLKGVGHVVCM